MNSEVNAVPVPLFKRKKPYLWALAGVGVLHGALYSFALSHPESQMGMQLFIGFTFNLALLGWCYSDAEEKKIPITRFLGLALFLAAVIGVPWYFVRSRGFVGAMKVGFGFGLLLLWAIAMELAFIACEAAVGHLHG